MSITFITRRPKHTNSLLSSWMTLFALARAWHVIRFLFSRWIHKITSISYQKWEKTCFCFCYHYLLNHNWSRHNTKVNSPHRLMPTLNSGNALWTKQKQHTVAGKSRQVNLAVCWWSCWVLFLLLLLLRLVIIFIMWLKSGGGFKRFVAAVHALLGCGQTNNGWNV